MLHFEKVRIHFSLLGSFAARTFSHILILARTPPPRSRRNHCQVGSHWTGTGVVQCQLVGFIASLCRCSMMECKKAVARLRCHRIRI